MLALPSERVQPRSESGSTPQDAFERWAALQRWSTDGTNRLDEAVDLAFWARIADGYDAECLARRVPEVLERVRQLVPRGASLLDVGAGTGGFSIPLAAQAGRVTALDYSPAMLAVLDRKIRADARLANITPMHCRWEDARVEPHDVVLAANALYRVYDLRPALDNLIRAARRRGIVVWSVGRDGHPHAADYRPGPDYLHLLDGLYTLNVFAHVEMLRGPIALIWWDATA